MASSNASNGRFTPEQVWILESAFAEGQYPGNRTEELAQTTSLSPEQVKNWFSRKRSESNLANARAEIRRLNQLVNELEECVNTCPICNPDQLRDLLEF